MEPNDIHVELERTRRALYKAQTALGDIERICGQTIDSRIQSGDSLGFRNADDEYRINTILRRLAQHAKGN